MKNESKIVELLSDSLRKQDIQAEKLDTLTKRVDTLTQVMSDQSKILSNQSTLLTKVVDTQEKTLNMLAKQSLILEDIRDELKYYKQLEERIVKLEKEVFSK